MRQGCKFSIVKGTGLIGSAKALNPSSTLTEKDTENKMLS
jgi:hypothetical protein